MEENLIPATDICQYHEVEFAFINSLGDAGLIALKFVDQDIYLPEDQLQKLEKMIRMHHELEINLAGIEAITHLLERVEHMQQELRSLKNRRHFH
jgi:chaperone modulatory protein CbpM